MKKKSLLSEVRRMQKIAGLLKEDFDAPQSVDLEKVFNKYVSTLYKALEMRAKNREDMDAHDAVKQTLEAISKELGLDPNLPYMEDEMFSGIVSPKKAIEHAKEMFTDMLSDHSDLS